MKLCFVKTLTLGLFQILFARAQDFDINVAAALAIPSSAYTYSVVYDSVGQSVYFTGWTYVSIDGQPSPINGNADVFLTRHWLNGSRLWSRLAGGVGSDYGLKLVQNSKTSDLFVCGYGDSSSIDGQSGAGGSDSIVFKYASNGTKLFTRIFGTFGQDSVHGAFFDAQNQHFVTTGLYNGYIAVTKNDINNGSVLKQFQFPVGGFGFGVASAATNSDCYVTGKTASNSSFDGQAALGGSDVFLTRMSYNNGTRYWSRIWGNSSDDEGFDVEFDPKSRLVFVVGDSAGSASVNGQPSHGSKDALLICTAENGTHLWTRLIGGAWDDTSSTLAIHPITGTLFVVGLLNSGFVATFSQNGTMFQLKTQAGSGSMYQGITIAPSLDVAYLAEFDGTFVTLNISFFPALPGSVTTFPGATLTSRPTTIMTAASGASTTVTTLAMTTLVNALFVSTFETNPTVTEIAFLPSLTSTPTPNDTDFNAPGTGTSTTQSRDIIYASIIYASIGAASILVIVLSALACYFLQRRRRAKPPAPYFDSTSINPSDYTQTTSTTAAAQSTSMSTFVRSQFELSLPGYLMFKNGPSFRVRRQIARGGGGVVSVADALTLTLTAYGTSIIVKTVGPGNGAPLSDLTERQQELLKQEISIMHYFREEKYIAKLLGWCSDPACILMKLYPRGSLDGWIYGTPVKTLTLILRFMQNIALGVAAMHAAGFVHSDLKPQNVLVDTDERDELYCCLTDFGITQIVDETTLLVKDFAVWNVHGLSTKYAAPEVFERFRLKSATSTLPADLVMKTDLYSLGVIMFELLNRRDPWDNLTSRLNRNLN